MWCAGGLGETELVAGTYEYGTFDHPGHQCQTTFTMRAPLPLEDASAWYYCSELAGLRMRERTYRNWLFTPLHPALNGMSMTGQQVLDDEAKAKTKLPFKSRRVRRNLTMPTNWDEADDVE